MLLLPRLRRLAGLWLPVAALFCWGDVRGGYGGPRLRPCEPFVVNNAAGNYVIPGVMGEIPYRTVDGRTLLLDAWRQQGEKQPAVVIIHGGGWTSGSRLAYVSQFQELLAAHDFNWITPDYRLAPASIEQQLDDLEAVFEFVRCHQDELGVDPGRIALLGEDTGAYLAARLAARLEDRLNALVLVGGIYDLRESSVLASAPALQKSLLGSTGSGILASRSLLRNPGAGFPPTLLIHGGRDSESPAAAAQAFCAALAAEGGRCDFRLVDGGIHRAENWPPHLWPYKRSLVAWLSSTMRGGKSAVPTTWRSADQGRLRKSIQYSRVEQAPLHDSRRLDAYIPDGPGPHPAVIVVHGGGWEAGSSITYVVPALKMLGDAGFAWFSIDYRLTPEVRNEEQIEDVRRAIRFVRHHAADYRIDPHRLALLGESAGGQMVMQAAALPCPPRMESNDPVEQESCKVQAVVSYYGVYDFEPMVKDVSARSLLVRLFDYHRLDQQGRELLRSASPINFVHAGMPPLLMVHGNNEFLWQQAVVLSRRLDEVGATYQLVALEGAPHGMENWEGHPEWLFYKKTVTDWLRKELGVP